MRWWRWGDLYATCPIHCDRKDHLTKDYTNRSSWNESTNETVLLANDLFFTKTWRSEGIKKRPSTRPQIANFPIFSVLLNTFIQFNLPSYTNRSTGTLGFRSLRYAWFTYILNSCKRSRVSPLLSSLHIHLTSTNDNTYCCTTHQDSRVSMNLEVHERERSPFAV